MTEKQEKFLEREDKLLKKLDEISNWQQPGPQVPLPMKQASMVGHQASDCLLNPAEHYVPQNQSITTYRPPFVWDSADAPTSVRLHHMQPLLNPSIHKPATEPFHLSEHASSYRQALPALGYQYHPPSSSFASESAPSLSRRGHDDAVVPASALNIHMQQNHQAAIYPTAAIAPMRPVPDHPDQQSLCLEQERNITEPVTSKGTDKWFKLIVEKHFISVRAIFITQLSM